MLWNTSMSPARSGRLRTSSRITCLSRLIASRLMPSCWRRRSSLALLPIRREVGGTTASEMPARAGLNRSPRWRRREDMRRNWFWAKSATCWRGPITPSTLPTQIRMSAGGASRVSLPALSASSNGASCSDSASATVMPTSGLSALTISSNTSPSMP